jgi:hypothetical protein
MRWRIRIEPTPRPCQASTTTNAISARGREDDVSAAASDDLAAGFLRERDECDMVFKIDVHEKSALLVREVALHCKETALQRLCAGLFDRGEQVSFILPSKSPDLDLASVAKKLARSIVGGIRHWGSYKYCNSLDLCSPMRS